MKTATNIIITKNAIITAITFFIFSLCSDPLYLFPLLINVLSNLYNFCKYNISQNMVELQYKRGDFKSFIKLFDWHTDFL
jgi:hypothetical protein